MFRQLRDPRQRQPTGDDDCIVWSVPIVQNWHPEHDDGTQLFDTSLHLRSDVHMEAHFEQRPPLLCITAPRRLVAFLCFWLRSLALQEPGWPTHDREGGFYGPRCFTRALGSRHDPPAFCQMEQQPSWNFDTTGKP